MNLHVPTLIARKREGETLDPAEIRKLIEGYTAGEIPDYQMSAFAMAVFFQGMDAVETAALTKAMLESGDVFHHRAGHPEGQSDQTAGAQRKQDPGGHGKQGKAVSHGAERSGSPPDGQPIDRGAKFPFPPGGGRPSVPPK